MTDTKAEVAGPPWRPLSELQDSGLLWLINRVVFHPRGFALALALDPEGNATWELLGDGTEVWTMGKGIDEDALFAKVQELLTPRPR